MKNTKELLGHFEIVSKSIQIHTPTTYLGAFLQCFDAPFLSAFVYYIEAGGCDPQTAHFYANQYAYWFDLNIPEDPCNKGDWDIGTNFLSLYWESRSSKQYHFKWSEGGIVEAYYPEDSRLASSFKALEEAQEKGVDPTVLTGYQAYIGAEELNHVYWDVIDSETQQNVGEVFAPTLEEAKEIWFNLPDSWEEVSIQKQRRGHKCPPRKRGRRALS